MANRHWAGHVYYYLAALVGLGFVIAGLVMTTHGLLQAALPTATPEYQYRSDPRSLPRYEEEKTPSSPTPAQIREAKREARSALRTEGFYRALNGLAFAGVGFPVFWWHIRRARERERNDTGEPTPRAAGGGSEAG